MTVQLTTVDARESSCTTERATEAYLGVDLTMLGAVPCDSYANIGSELAVEYASFPMLASCATAACSGGLDLITLSSTFRIRSDKQGAAMDAARTMARLTQLGAAGFSAEVPPTHACLEEAITLLSSQREGWGGVEITVDDAAVLDVDQLTSAITLAHDLGVTITARVPAREVRGSSVETLASFADTVRLLTEDPHEAREARFALRSAARDAGRVLTVFVELGVVISGNRQAAIERCRLIEDMQGGAAFTGKARVVGTVYDVADAVENWIGLGAADGVIFMPASLPTDLASLIKGVIPLLKARSAAPVD